jgi:hypothetical protein
MEVVDLRPGLRADLASASLKHFSSIWEIENGQQKASSDE